MNRFSRNNIFYILLATIMLIIDYSLKVKIKSSLELGQSVDVIKNFFKLTYIQNTGAAFGILQNQKWIFLIVGSIMIMLLMSVFIKTSDFQTKLSISLIISGAIGNIIDRILYGYVVDMFDFHAIWSYVFNFADICVVIGIILFSIRVLKEK